MNVPSLVDWMKLWQKNQNLTWF